jgi:lactoylglutathione lyase
MAEATKAHAIGFNHVALEVGDIEEALAFYGRLFDFTLRGKSGTSAFIDLGDQFLALQKGRTQPADEGRHFGLVVGKIPIGLGISSGRIYSIGGSFAFHRIQLGGRVYVPVRPTMSRSTHNRGMSSGTSSSCASGPVRMNAVAGPRIAHGTGRFGRFQDSGTWAGTGPSGVCTGVWSAARS